MITFQLPAFPRQAAELIFPHEEYVVVDSKETKAWTLKSTAVLTAVLGSLLPLSDYLCAGASRGFQTKSQPFIRNIAHMLPDFEVNHVVLPSGVEQLYVNGMYAIVTEHGEIHWPKDNQRLEIGFGEDEEKAVREQVLSDMMKLAQGGGSISPVWWRQLGDEERATAVETELAAPRPSKRRRKGDRKKANALKPPRQPRFTKEAFEIDQIVAAKRVSGKATVLYLVRWQGYDVSWEPYRINGQPGQPIETWEPRLLVLGTEALQTWRDRAEELRL